MGTANTRIDSGFFVANFIWTTHNVGCVQKSVINSVYAASRVFATIEQLMTDFCIGGKIVNKQHDYTLVEIYWTENTPENQDRFWNSSVKFDDDRMYFFIFNDESSITYAASEEMTIDEFLADDWSRIQSDVSRIDNDLNSVTLIFKEWIDQHEPDWTGSYEPDLNYEYVGVLDTTKLRLAVADKSEVIA